MSDESKTNPLPTLDAGRPPAPAEPIKPTAAPVPGAASPPTEVAGLYEKIVKQIQTVYDPEIPVNIHELGLIYAIDIDADKNVAIKMTLTAPSCPSAQVLPVQVRDRVQALDEVNSADVEVVWDPPWTPALMTDAARLTLNMF